MRLPAVQSDNPEHFAVIEMNFLNFFFPVFNRLAAYLMSHVLSEIKEGISIPFDFLHFIQNLSHLLLFMLLNICRFSYVDLLTPLACHQNIIT